jgi:hypothetical protein
MNMRPSNPPSTLRSVLVLFSVLALIAMAAGCASEPKVVPSSGPRPATSAQLVKFYQKAPQRYEMLGKITVTREEGAKWDQRGDANAAFENARAKAAALGANGLLLAANKGEYDALATAGHHGTFYQVPIKGRPPVGMFQAIYVLEE